MRVVLDAAALLCVFLDEVGSENVVPVMRGSVMSSLNASECFSRAVDKGFTAQAVMTIINELEIEIVPFDLSQALRAAELRPRTAHVGASLGDRACLALAQARDLPMFTGDRRLGKLDLGIDIRLIR